MPGIVRLSTKELDELIEVTEAAEGDATELNRLLAEVIEEGKGFGNREIARNARWWAEKGE